MGDLSKNFSTWEFKCKCGCGFVQTNDALIHKLQQVRNIMGKPIGISSGCRCEEHNAAVGGESTSAHLTGEGADIVCYHSRGRFNLLPAVFSVGFKRIGVKKDCIHVDVSGVLAQGVLWLY